MTVELRRFSRPLTVHRLAAALHDPSNIQTESLNITADFDEVKNIFKDFRTTNPSASSLQRAKLDRELALPLHKALARLTRRTATDMGMWHWLCICEFKDVVWYRWYGRTPTDLSRISTSLAERFLGAPTLHGISRNALARLWWCVESLASESGEYDLVNTALSSQDLFLQLFDRAFSLYVPAAKAYLRTLQNASQDEWRDAARELDHYFTTIAAEGLNEEDITRELLSKYVEQSSN